MPSNPLPMDQVLELLNADKQRIEFKATQAPNNINGPLKYYDREMRCSNRGCSSPTHYKVDGIPRCHTHAINELNQIVYDLTNRLRDKRYDDEHSYAGTHTDAT